VPPSARIPVDSVKGLDVLGLPVARLALLIIGLAVRYGLGRKRNGSGDRRAEAERDYQTVAKLSSATAQTQVAARTRLLRLGSTVIQKTEQTRVTIRVTDRKDMEVAQKVADALKEKQFTIDKIEALDAPARGEVRYYFNEDERAAEQIRLITESVIAEGGYIVQLPSNFAATKERINPGAVEVSLPSLSAQLIRPSYRRFEARKKS
jgi:hypothetical protein